MPRLDERAAAPGPLAEAPGQHRERVHCRDPRERRVEPLAVGEGRAGAERQHLEPLGGDDLPPGEKAQARPPVAAGEKRDVLARGAEAPAAGGRAAAAGGEAGEGVVARGLGEEEPARRVPGQADPGGAGADVGERPLEQARLVEARVDVHMRVHQHRNPLGQPVRGGRRRRPGRLTHVHPPAPPRVARPRPAAAAERAAPPGIPEIAEDRKVHQNAGPAPCTRKGMSHRPGRCQRSVSPFLTHGKAPPGSAAAGR